MLGNHLISIKGRPQRGVAEPGACYCRVGPLLYPGLYQPSQEGLYGVHCLQLLLVCRQIYAEARLLPFTLNTFEYSSYEGVQSWTQHMPTQMGSIKTFRIWSMEGTINPHDTFVTLPHLPGLKVLEIVIILDSFAYMSLFTDGNLWKNDPWIIHLTPGERQRIDSQMQSIEAKAKELLRGRAEVVLLQKMCNKELD